jgi:hypothetical protein
MGGMEVVGLNDVVLTGGNPKGDGACPPGGDPNGDGGGASPLGGDLDGSGGAWPPGEDPHDGGQ